MFKQISRGSSMPILVGENGNLIVPFSPENSKVAVLISPRFIPVRLIDVQELNYLKQVINVYGRISQHCCVSILHKLSPSDGMVIVSSSLGVYEMQYSTAFTTNEEIETPYDDEDELEDYFQFNCHNLGYYKVAEL